MKKKLGVILIATGKYSEFIEPLLKSIQSFNNFNYEISYYIFSDTDYSNEAKKINSYYWSETNWPYPTLLRYHKICEIKEILIKNDFLIYLDIDMQVKEFFPDFKDNYILAVKHPGYVKTKKAPFENNKLSKAYLSKAERQIYVCGGVQGGDAKIYLNICQQIKNDIDVDLEKNYIPKWHDESYWNKYVNKAIHKQVLDRSYCWPEQWVTTQNPGRIVALQKRHQDFRNNIKLSKKLKFEISNLFMTLKKPRKY